jgi:hypothetical protein
MHCMLCSWQVNALQVSVVAVEETCPTEKYLQLNQPPALKQAVNSLFLLNQTLVENVISTVLIKSEEMSWRPRGLGWYKAGAALARIKNP